jgi:putative tryptophan/tyrosine transport system substrate-binding protein
MRLARLTVPVALALTLLAVPLAVSAQPAGKIPRIGFLGPGPVADWDETKEAFRQELRALGYIEGQNISIEWRFTVSGYDRLPDLAAELVQLNPDVIVTVTTPAAKAAKAATTTIPIVMSGVARPVEQGLVASMARPGGNATGTTNHPGLEVLQKQLQLLKEAAPRVSRVAVLNFGAEPELSFVGTLHDAGQALGVTTVPVTVASPAQFDRAALTQARPDALYVMPNSVNGAHAQVIRDFAATNRLPTIYGDDSWVRAGGLMSYNADWLAMRRRAAALVVKILNGTKPADIPVEDPTTFRLVINLKTAKALGLTIPPSVLARADEIIQ